MRFDFSKILFWLGLVHVTLGAAIEHTKHHNTLTAIDDGISVVEGLAGAIPTAAPATVPPAAASQTGG